MIRDIINVLKEELHKSHIENEMYMRLKEPYSVLKKMKRKEATVQELKDLIACRVIVKNKDECYHAKNIIENFSHLILLHTKDYIHKPKSNGYQSIHNIMQFKYSRRHLEVQIRSEDMHKDAELGRAAHLNYKAEQDKHLKKIFDTANDTILHKARRMVKHFKGLEEQILEYEEEIMRVWHAKYHEVLEWESGAKVLIFNEE